jgi:hypothetical protein
MNRLSILMKAFEGVFSGTRTTRDWVRRTNNLVVKAKQAEIIAVVESRPCLQLPKKPFLGLATIMSYCWILNGSATLKALCLMGYAAHLASDCLLDRGRPWPTVADCAACVSLPP